MAYKHHKIHAFQGIFLVYYCSRPEEVDKRHSLQLLDFQNPNLVSKNPMFHSIIFFLKSCIIKLQWACQDLGCCRVEKKHHIFLITALLRATASSSIHISLSKKEEEEEKKLFKLQKLEIGLAIKVFIYLKFFVIPSKRDQAPSCPGEP